MYSRSELGRRCITKTIHRAGLGFIIPCYPFTGESFDRHFHYLPPIGAPAALPAASAALSAASTAPAALPAASAALPAASAALPAASAVA